MDRRRARHALERDFVRCREAPMPRPRQGWVRAIRDALGMTTRDLARRLDSAPSWVTQLEQNEVDGSLTLRSLQRAAEALGCRLEYVLVPERPLEDIVREQAGRKAARQLAAVDHTMALERQRTDEDSRHREVERLTEAFVDQAGLWSVE